MKIEFKFDLYTLLMVGTLCILLFFTWRSATILVAKQIEYNYLIEQNKQYIFDYSCDSGFDTKFYNCPTNESKRNITGTYCYGIMLC